jgi:hypothetical protein
VTRDIALESRIRDFDGPFDRVAHYGFNVVELSPELIGSAGNSMRGVGAPWIGK